MSVACCQNCGATDAMVYFPGSGCSKCESPRPKLGEISNYCDSRMHFHCEAEFDYDCGCGCHEHFDKEMQRTKPMTEEYFFMMMNKGYLTWIHLAPAVPLEPILDKYDRKKENRIFKSIVL
jgi:hypothetical protein